MRTSPLKSRRFPVEDDGDLEVDPASFKFERDQNIRFIDPKFGNLRLRIIDVCFDMNGDQRALVCRNLEEGPGPYLSINLQYDNEVNIITVH